MKKIWGGRRSGGVGGAGRVALGLGVAVGLLTSGCSIERMAINRLGNALAGGGSTFASDNDPELVRDAVPFSLKLIETLLVESPGHEGLLRAAAEGFTQYAYAFVQMDADLIEEEDFAAAERLRGRARNLYLRGRDYALRGLEVRHAGLGAGLRADPVAAVGLARAADVPLLYWAAVSWGALISVSKDDPELIADQKIVGALIDRALALDPDFGDGAIHSFLITFEMARAGGAGDPEARARAHFERALALSGGLRADPWVSYAESVAVAQQDRKLFESLLARARAIDSDALPEARLANLIYQRRAEWLLSRADDLFFTPQNE